jgi:WD40 repeat protein
MRVPVVTCSGRELACLDAELSWRLREVLAAVPEEKSVAPCSRRRVFLGETELCRQGATLADVGFESGSSLTLVVTQPPDKAIAGIDGSVTIYCAMEFVCKFVGHADHVTSVVLSPDGWELATASNDCTAKVWSIESGECLRTLTGHRSSVRCVGFSPDGEFVATASDDGTAKIWSIKSAEFTQAVRTLEGHTASLATVMFSPDGQTVLTASMDRTAKIWLADSGECLHTLGGHVEHVKSAVFSFDGRHVVTVQRDDTAKIWSAESGECTQTFEPSERATRFIPPGTLYR